jgi:hypothetical protein
MKMIEYGKLTVREERRLTELMTMGSEEELVLKDPNEIIMLMWRNDDGTPMTKEDAGNMTLDEQTEAIAGVIRARADFFLGYSQRLMKCMTSMNGSTEATRDTNRPSIGIAVN